MEHRRRGSSTIRQNPLTRQLRLRLLHSDVDCFLAWLRLHVLADLRVPLVLVSWGRRRGLLLDHLARGVVLLLGRRQLQQTKSIRRRIRQFPGVALPSATANEQNISRATKKMEVECAEEARGTVPGGRRPGRER